ncbi:uncharacterized protein EDB93DRAFT_277244 [Suillus bovinus]|uniref:uncharacterized protein n=1 Tax=Suillus bovinus TaxID=48563 RepID=UPI001B866E65|nr:uncharacterized protein EDB93DRAFT_277244 [Suillus bovinus]KAG2159277.1 hypothetical protein EDB93DRAFT_277244 [Suillus bovinus]
MSVSSLCYHQMHFHNLSSWPIARMLSRWILGCQLRASWGKKVYEIGMRMGRSKVIMNVGSSFHVYTHLFQYPLAFHPHGFLFDQTLSGFDYQAHVMMTQLGRVLSIEWQGKSRGFGGPRYASSYSGGHVTLRWSTDRRETPIVKQKADHVELKWSADRRVTRFGSTEPNISYIHMLEEELKWSADRRVTRFGSTEPNVSYIHLTYVTGVKSVEMVYIAACPPSNVRHSTTIVSIKLNCQHCKSVSFPSS